MPEQAEGAPESAGGSLFSRWTEGRFGRWLLPAVVAQSVLIGGGYASGREVVEFGAKYGTLGWVSVLAIFVGFTLVSILVFEVARVTSAYDYKGFVERLIGGAWPVFDVLYVLMAVLVIAVMASAAGSIMDATLGIPYAVGVGAIVVVVGLVTYEGAHFIEAFKSVGTAGLYVGYIVFGVVVIGTRWDAIGGVLAAGDTSYVEAAGVGDALGSGLLYVGYNLVLYPAVLFTLHRQRGPRDTVVSGILAGSLVTLPFLLTYLCVLAFYPAEGVLGAEVPWVEMMDAVGGPWLLALYGVVIGWTLLETSVGLIHALTDRIDRGLREAGGSGLPNQLTNLQRGLLGAGVLLGAALLTPIGIVDLIAGGYTLMAYLFLLVFLLPLATVGLLRVRQGPAPATERTARVVIRGSE